MGLIIHLDKVKKAMSPEKRKMNGKIAEIFDLEGRIRTILIIARYCKDNGIEIPFSIRSKGGLIADKSHHQLGIMQNYIAVGYYGGGSMEPWDFYTDGTTIVERSQDDDQTETRTPDISRLETFLEDFPTFEKAFYDWFDKVIDTKQKELMRLKTLRVF